MSTDVEFSFCPREVVYFFSTIEFSESTTWRVAADGNLSVLQADSVAQCIIPYLIGQLFSREANVQVQQVNWTSNQNRNDVFGVRKGSTRFKTFLEPLTYQGVEV